MTPRELVARMEGARRRMRREARERAWLALHTAALPDVARERRRWPTVDDLTGEARRAGPMTVDQIAAALRLTFGR